LNNQEAEKIIDRLKYSFTYNKFDEPAAIGEYKRVFARYSYEQMNRAVENLIENDKDGRNVPPIPALIKACKENRQSGAEVVNSLHCDVCNDKGYALMTEHVKNGNEILQYQYALYCPFCTVGQSQAYNGNNCKDHKANAVCEPMTKYFDEQVIEQMRYDNNHSKRLADAEKEILRKKLTRIGLRLPQALDHGDAWEGEEQCPF
jgi:hypothetical protein